MQNIFFYFTKKPLKFSQILNDYFNLRFSFSYYNCDEFLGFVDI